MASENACTRTTDKAWTSDWEYVGAYPIRVVGSTAPGTNAIGVGDARYVWKRKFKVKYTCTCGGKTAEVWIDGNYAYHTADVLGRGYVVLRVNVPLPLRGAFGAIADALGASLTIAQWWQNPALVNAEKPAGPGANAGGSIEDFEPTPVAICGTKIRIGDGTFLPWPPEGVPADDSVPYIMLKCPGTDTIESGSIGHGIWTRERTLVMAELLAKVVARRRAGRYASAYRCEEPCDPKPATKLTFEKVQVMQQPREVGGDFISSVYVPWTLELSCSVRTSSLDQQGEHYAMGSFVVSDTAPTSSQARQQIMLRAPEQAWEEALAAAAEAHFGEEAEETPWFRISLADPEFQELDAELSEELSEEGVAVEVAYFSWQLEVEEGWCGAPEKPAKPKK